MKEYDILVIGAGAGTKLVTPPSLIGKRVAVFEKESPGGTCLNRGCIPSKMVIYPSELIRMAKDTEKFPVFFKERPEADVEKIFLRVNETVKQDSDSIPIAYDKNPNIDFYPKQVRFVSERVLSDGTETYTAKHIFVVTGTRPHIPEIPGLKTTPFWTSREALSPDKFPKSMIIIGGGFISLELGAAYQAYGCQVTGLTRTEILRTADGDIKKELSNHLPFPIESHYQIEKVEFENGEFRVTGKTKEGKSTIHTAERLLVATGIRPNTDDLGLENTKIKTNDAGYILVNDHSYNFV